MKWYLRAAEMGSRASFYRLGVLQSDRGKFSDAEKSFKEGSKVDFPPSMYRLATLYLEHRRSATGLDAPRLLLERASKLGHLFSNRDLATLYITGTAWPRNLKRGVFLLFLLLFRIVKLLIIKLIKGPYLDEKLIA
jgi:TPR repeat protein